MSMEELKEALSIVDAHPDRADFAGPRDPAVIAAAESALGVRLPSAYREFVSRLGAGNFGAFEVYGVITPNFEKSTIPDGIGLTLKKRRDGWLPSDLLIIGSTGDGAYVCLQLRDEGDGRVVEHMPGQSGGRRGSSVVSENFGAFFLAGVRDQL